MKLLMLFLSILFHFSLPAMEPLDDFNPFEWHSMKLKTLLAQANEYSCSSYNRQVRAAKMAFVEKYKQKYDDQQAILSDLLKETKGVVRATADEELAAKDPNKFLCIDPMQCTADEIDARWKCIHHADCKNMGAQNSGKKSQEINESRGPLHDIPGMLPPT